MKRTVLISVVMFMVLRVSAQTPCIPDSINFPKDSLISPGSLNATADVDYNQTVQFKFPTDTTVDIGGQLIKINKVTLDSVANMPSSFSYQCGNKTCTYKGGQYGCATITGSPTSSQVGVDTLKVYFTANITIESGFLAGTNTNDTASGRVLLTIDSSGLSNIFDQPAVNKFAVSQNYPNPFNIGTEMTFNSPAMQTVCVVVRDELGQLVYTRRLHAVQGSNSFDFERNGLPEGIYFYSFQTGDNIITRRMSIKN